MTQRCNKNYCIILYHLFCPWDPWDFQTVSKESEGTSIPKTKSEKPPLTPLAKHFAQWTIANSPVWTAKRCRTMPGDLQHAWVRCIYHLIVFPNKIQQSETQFGNNIWLLKLWSWTLTTQYFQNIQNILPKAMNSRSLTDFNDKQIRMCLT